jgi:hypothetical protein
MVTSIVFYNWEKFGSLPFSKISKVLKSFPDNSVLREEYKGKSFLLRPEKVWLYNPTELEVAQMLQVASTRNHFNYWFNGFKGAYLDFSCSLQQRSSLERNNLLRIDETNRFIYLRHEE